MEIKMLLLNRHVRLLALKSKVKPALTIRIKKGRADGNLRQPYPTVSWYIWRGHAQSLHLSLFANCEAFMVFDDREDRRSHCNVTPVKVARTYLYARWLCFKAAFFGRKDLAYFYDFCILNKEWNCYLFSCRFKTVWDISICLKPHFTKMSITSKPPRPIFL